MRHRLRHNPRLAKWTPVSRRPRVEHLEDRTLLSVQAASPAADISALRIDPAHYDSSAILVRFKSDAGCNALGCSGVTGSEILDGTTLGRGSDLVPGLQQIRLSSGVSVDRALEAYRANPLVEYAEPDYRIHLSDFPNDPRFGEQWNLHNTGQTGGTVNADIDAPEAWRVNTGTAATIVALIDSGVDYTHPDLAANMWQNPGEIPGDGIDNDSDGLIDDVFGYDFANGDGDPFDDNGHGTHVAGILGAVGDNSIGVTGVDWNVRIMALKFTDAAGNGTIADAIAALNYAVAHGATISNNSWQTSVFSSALRDAIANAQTRGHILVAAAGNGGADQVGDDLDVTPVYPAAFDLDNVLAVAATDQDDQLASFSNFGANSVDLAAPGVNILSTVPTAGPYGDPSGYRHLSGTSMATPHVAGVVGLLRDQHPDWTYRQVLDRVLSTVDPLDDLQNRTVTSGRLSAGAAVASTFPFQFNIGSGLPDAAFDITYDVNGNTYIAGSFLNPSGADAPINFDPTDDAPEPSDFLTSRGGTDIFVAKYSEKGELLWARSMGGQSQDEALAIAVDESGNVYTTGRFSGIGDFDPAPGNNVFLLNSAGFNPDISETQCRALLQSSGFADVLDAAALAPCRDVLASISNDGTGDVFISKLDSDGNFLWARNVGGSGAVGRDLAVEAAGNLYFTGDFFGLADFDPGPAASELGSIANGASQAFVASLSPDGSFRWAREIGFQENNDTGSGIAVSRAGDVFVTGTLEIQSGADHLFLQRLTRNGVVLWDQTLDSTNGVSSVSAGIALTEVVEPELGEPLVNITGHFVGAVDFDPRSDAADDTRSTSNGNTDVFVARYNGETGDFAWVQSAAGLDNDQALAVAADRHGSVYATGAFRDTVQFNPNQPNASESRLTSSGSDDVFIWTLDNNGNFADAFRMGGADFDAGTGIALDPFGNILVTGIFRDGGTFDLDPNSELLTSNGDFDVFVTKIVQPLPPLDPVPAPPPPPPPVSAPPPPAQMAIFREGLWFFDLDQGGAAAERAFAFGIPSDIPVPGDWNGDGTADAAVFRDGLWFFDFDRAGGHAEHAIAFGEPGDIPVAGDWDGDGVEEAAVYRNGLWFFDLDGAGGPAEAAFAFGEPSDTPVPGDWNGDGSADAAVFRNGIWFFDLDGQGRHAEHAFAFGISGDVPVAGDWNGDGSADAAVFRNGIWFFDLDGNGGVGESAAVFGIGGDSPLAGLWELPPAPRITSPQAAVSGARAVALARPTAEQPVAANDAAGDRSYHSVGHGRLAAVPRVTPIRLDSVSTAPSDEQPSYAELVDEALLALIDPCSESGILALLEADL